MFYKLPINIRDYIFEFIDYKSPIQIYFKENIAPMIDISFKKINNGCELCYLKFFNKYKFKLCSNHKYMINFNSNKPKYISLHNLPNSKIYNKSLGRLFLALDDIHRFIQVINNINKYEMHKLHNINNEIRMCISKI